MKPLSRRLSPPPRPLPPPPRPPSPPLWPPSPSPRPLSRRLASRLLSRTGAVVSGKRGIGILCAITVVFFFSGFNLVSRLGLASSLTPVDVAALRFGVAGLVLLPILLRHGCGGLAWRQALALACCGGLGFALFAFTGFALAPAAHGGVLLHGTVPLFTFLISWLMTREAVTRWRLLSLAAILSGILAMAWDSVSGATPRQLLGDASLLMASICWSAYGLQVRRSGLAPAHAASVVAVLSMALILPIYLLLPGKSLALVSWPELLFQGAFQGVLIGAVANIIYSRAVASLGALETALFTAAVPCVTMTGAVLLLGEQPGVLAIVGVVAVTVGMALSLKG